ncbi:unnamed protein product [Calypogeia fissa]
MCTPPKQTESKRQHLSQTHGKRPRQANPVGDHIEFKAVQGGAHHERRAGAEPEQYMQGKGGPIEEARDPQNQKQNQEGQAIAGDMSEQPGSNFKDDQWTRGSAQQVQRAAGGSKQGAIGSMCNNEEQALSSE